MSGDASEAGAVDDGFSLLELSVPGTDDEPMHPCEDHEQVSRLDSWERRLEMGILSSRLMWSVAGGQDGCLAAYSWQKTKPEVS